MKGLKFFGFWLLIGLLCSQCNNADTQRKTMDGDSPLSSDGFAFNSKLKYADCFTIIPHEGFKQILVFDVWQDRKDTLSNIIIYPRDLAKPTTLPQHEYIVPVPIQDIAAMSSSHIGFLEILDELEKISGITESKRVYNTFVYNAFEEGKVKELGNALETNLEKLLVLNPELVMKTGFDDVRSNDIRIAESGIPVAYNIEWMESSMLARAEWIKFVAAFFCKEAMADSIFTYVETSYRECSKLAKDVPYHPTVLSGNNYKGTWFMPGGRSYISVLVQDAGGEYFYKDEPSKGSIPLSFEVVLENLVDAEYWFGPKASSLEELRLLDERYTIFKAFKTGKVYNYDKRISPRGGNDYWETGIVRPDLLLKDIISIFHPELLPDHELFFYRQMTWEPYTDTAH